MLNYVKRYPLVVATILVGALVLVLWLSGLDRFARGFAYVYVGAVIVWTAFGMLRSIMAGNFGLDLLALLAMISTLAVGEYGASLVIVLMLSGGEALEDYAAGRARGELTTLLAQAPQVAHLEVAGEVEEVPVNQLVVGDTVLVRPGEVVPVDGQILSEEGEFDESSLTGESLPQLRLQGQEVPSGAVNGSTAVRIKALRDADASQYQQIIELVRQSQDSQAPIVRLADRFALPFTLISLLIAGVAWAISGDPVRFAQVLVLATPCPLLIAAPVAFMGGLSFSAKNGVVFKGGSVLEQLARVKSAGFDKTGTITGGEPQLRRVVPASPHIDPEYILRLAGAAEQYSAHILAQTIVEASRDLPRLEVENAKEVIGQGVDARIEGTTVLVGKQGFADAGFGPVELEAGEVAVYVSQDGHYLGALVLVDGVRSEARQVLAYLRAEGVERLEMITGDHESTAQAIAQQAGIKDVLADRSPTQKVEAVAALDPPPTMMVGDGVNDAPALAAANVGIAMGAKGASAAGEAADAVVLQDSLIGVGNARAIAQHTVKVALTAIWIGIILSVGLMLIATTGIIPAMVGALTQELVDLATILYALRALRAPLPKWDNEA